MKTETFGETVIRHTVIRDTVIRFFIRRCHIYYTLSPVKAQSRESSTPLSSHARPDAMQPASASERYPGWSATRSFPMWGEEKWDVRNKENSEFKWVRMRGDCDRERESWAGKRISVELLFRPNVELSLSLSFSSSSTQSRDLWWLRRAFFLSSNPRYRTE